MAQHELGAHADSRSLCQQARCVRPPWTPVHAEHGGAVSARFCWVFVFGMCNGMNGELKVKSRNRICV